MDIDNLKSLLRKYNLRPNFTFGQNFLIDDDVLKNIVETADISSCDQILEIGPGIGNLTRKLCESAGFVLSVEKDPKFLPVLRSIKKDFPKNFRFEIADILEFDYITQLETWNMKHTSSFKLHDSSFKVVANIPYYVTGKILELLMNAKHKPSSITILAQKEVAQRVCASAGELSVLAISVQIYGEPKIIRMVSKDCFYPAPKVDSAILQIKIYQVPRYKIGDEKKFFRIVKACFAGKRKQIHNTLVNNLKLNKNRVAEILSVLKISPAARPQELEIGQWIELAEKLF